MPDDINILSPEERATYEQQGELIPPRRPIETPTTPLSQEEGNKLLAAGSLPQNVELLAQGRQAAATDEWKRRIKAQSFPVSEEYAVRQMNEDAEKAKYPKVDPLTLFNDDQLTDDKHFSLEGYVSEHPDVMQDNARVARLASIMQKRNSKPITGADVWEGTKGLAAGAVRQGWNLAKGTATMINDVFGYPITASVAGLTGQGDEFQAELAKMNDKQLASDLAGLEKGSFGFFNWAGRLPKTLGRKVGLATSWKDMTPAQAQAEFRAQMEDFRQGEEIGAGRGSAVWGLIPIPGGGLTVQQMREIDSPETVVAKSPDGTQPVDLDFDRVKLVAEADPPGFLAFSMAMGGASAAKQAVTASAKAEGQFLASMRECVRTVEHLNPNSPWLAASKEILAQAEKDAGFAAKAYSKLAGVSERANSLLTAQARVKLAQEAVKRFNSEAAQNSLASAEAALDAARNAPLAARMLAATRQVTSALRPSELAPKAAGAALEATGLAAKSTGQVARALPWAVAGGGAIQQLMSGNPWGAVWALTAGKVANASRIGKILQRPLQAAGEAASEAGRAIRTGAPETMTQKAIIGGAKGLGELAENLAEGGAMDVGFALALADNAEQVRDMGAFGTLFKGIGGLRSVPERYVKTMLTTPMRQVSGPAAPRAQGGVRLAVGERATQASRQLMNEDGLARINNTETFLRGVGSDSPVYVFPDVASTASALTEQFQRKNGRAPNEAEAADLQNQAEQRGMFSQEVIGDNGQRGNAVFVTALEAAPHEAQHAFQSVLGPSGNAYVDQVVQEHYGDQWNGIASTYTARLTGQRPTEGWREQLRRFIPSKVVEEAMATGRDAADIYIAREIAAENFSTLFEATGGKPQGDQGLLYKLAKVVDRTANWLGVDLLAGTQTPGDIGIQPKGAAMGAIQETARAATPAEVAAPVIRPAPATPIPRAPAASAPPPVTPEQRASEAAQARTVAEQAPNTTLPGATMSQREILGAVAEAIANDEGVQYNYRQAPGAAGSAIEQQRTVRRAEIESARNMPEDVRQLVEKRGAPYRIARTTNGVFQIYDWAPDMLASNAMRWAKSLSELAARDPGNVALKRVPYELDVQAGEWTEQGWRDLFRDAEKFNANQSAGFTGSGIRLPAETIQRVGRFAPPETGTPTPLDQGRADFLNLLHNLRAPETPRITGRKLPGNIAAQEISAATIPGRVGEPAARARGGARQPFAGEKAREMGIEGRPIQEVNPLRGDLEKALQAQKIALPDGIEVVRRLNLEHLAAVTAEPNLPRTTGRNVLTLEAGFLPRAARLGEEKVEQAAFRLSDGSLITGKTHFMALLDAVNSGKIPRDTLEKGVENIGEDGFVTSKGRFVTRQEALELSKEVGQLTPAQAAAPAFRGGELEATDFQAQRAFLPASREGYDAVDKMSPKEFAEHFKAGGLQDTAMGIGKAVGPEIIPVAESALAGLPAKRKIAMAAGDFDSAYALANKAQFYGEVIKGAKGETAPSTQALPKNVYPVKARTAEARPEYEWEKSQPGYVGVVEGLKVKAKKVLDLFDEKETHEDIFGRSVATGTPSWRYNPKTQGIYWWDIQNVSRDAKDEVRAFLEKKGEIVNREFGIGVGFPEETLKAAHGQALPKGAEAITDEAKALETGGYTVAIEHKENVFKEPLINILVKDKKGELVGDLNIELDADGKLAHIESVAVRKNARRKGIALAMHLEAARQLERLGFSNLSANIISVAEVGAFSKAFPGAIFDEGISPSAAKARIIEGGEDSQIRADFELSELAGQASPRKPSAADILKRGEREALTPEEEQRLAQSTARVWPRTVTSKVVEDRVDKGASLLDFGSGPEAMVTRGLRDAGYKDVTAYDFTESEYTDPAALSRKYDNVMASNVLNVQASDRMLADTMADLHRVSGPSTKVLANYPSSPRHFREGGYSSKTKPMPAEAMEAKLRKYWDNVERVGGSKSEPVWELSGPKAVEQTGDRVVAPATRAHINEMATTETPTTARPKVALPLTDSGVPASPDGATAGGPLMQAMARGYKEWLEKQWFGNKAVKDTYSPEEIESFAKGLEMTAKLFGDFSMLPPEVVDATPKRPNMDPKFPFTVDFTTVCPKQDQFVAVTKALEKEQGRIFTAKEKAAIVEMVREAGYAACWICYGQSARNMWDQSVQQVTDILNKAKTMEWTTGESTPATQALFGTWTDTGALRKFIDENHASLKQSGEFNGPRLRELIRGETPAENPFEQSVADITKRVAQAAAKANAPKGYAAYVDQFLGKAAKAEIEEVNRIAGARFNSQSDFRIWHVLDMAQTLGHLKTQEGMAHAYTRIDEFLRIFRDTGFKFNMSVELSDPLSLPLSARRGRVTYDEYKALKKEHGDPMWDDMNSFPEERVDYWRKELPNDAGGMLVASNDYQVWWGLDSPKIDMIIPYHQGSVKPETTAFYGAKDYKSEQHEHFPEDWKTGETRSVTLKDGEKVSLTMAEPNKRAAMIVRDVHKNSRERYLEICEKFGIEPLFARFRDHPNYMKLIRDVAREPMKQRVVDASKINWDEAMKIVDEWVASGAYKSETEADPGLLRLVRDRVKEGDLPISPVIKAGHAKSIEEILKFKPKTTTEPVIRKKVKPPTGPGQKSVAEQLKEK